MIWSEHSRRPLILKQKAGKFGENTPHRVNAPNRVKDTQEKSDKRAKLKLAAEI